MMCNDVINSFTDSLQSHTESYRVSSMLFCTSDLPTIKRFGLSHVAVLVYLILGDGDGDGDGDGNGNDEEHSFFFLLPSSFLVTIHHHPPPTIHHPPMPSPHQLTLGPQH